MGINDYTLGDLAEHDRDNFAHVLKKKGKVYKFVKYNDALAFMGQCFKSIMKKVGVKIKPGIDGEKIDKTMKEKKVKVEHREYPPEEELYRTGIFIYDNREIAGYVSNPFIDPIEVKYGLLPRYYIHTTAKGV